jgi:hypothetical protein
VLFATFLSPGFAWQAVASHSGLAHAEQAAVAVDGDHHDHGSGASAAIHVAHDDHHDAAAHADIGHLLSHLPAVMAEAAPLPSPAAGVIDCPPRLPAVPRADPEPPYKPPRSLPSA